MENNSNIHEQETIERTIKFFEAVLRSSPNGIVVTDASQGIVLANEKFCSLINQSVNNVKETNISVWLEEFNDNAPSTWTELVMEVCRVGQVYDYHYSITNAEDIRYLSVNASLVEGLKLTGDQCTIVSTWSDITERKKVEEKVTRLAKFPSENPNPVLRVSSDGNIIYSNEASASLLDSWDSQISRALPEEYAKIVSEVLHSGARTNTCEVECYDRVISLMFAPIADEGYVNIYGLDITSRKKAERELKTVNETLEQHVEDRTAELKEKNIELIKEIAEREKMEQALVQTEKLKSLGTITAGISHEFNNILNVISGNIQLLQMDYEDNHKLIDSFRTIMKSVNDGAEITDRMLDFTKTESTSDDFVSTELIKLIDEALDFTMPRWKTEAQAKGIAYNINKEGFDDIPDIMCNPSGIREVFVNIINNALDAMPDGGTILFSIRSQKNMVFIHVSDTGKGMSTEVQKSVFDPFFTTRRPEGTGLGLSIAYSIIKRHGGNIGIESMIGSGSTFTLELPTSIKTVSPTATQGSIQEAVGKELHILVVDDEKQTCDILARFLSGKGYKVKAVYNGADAIELIKSVPFNLVLCDHVMPDVTGCAVARFMSGLEKRPKIGIITGWGEINKCINEEGVEVDFIIKKPFDFSVLTKYINDLFGDE